MHYQVALKPDNKLKRIALFHIVQSFEGTFTAADVDLMIWAWHPQIQSVPNILACVQSKFADNQASHQ